MSLTPYSITFNNNGLVQNKKPFLLLDNAFQTLNNAYVFRDRVKKREGLQLVGRLRRIVQDQSLSDTIATNVQFNLFTQINLSGAITNITQANPGQVTTAANHHLLTGQVVRLTNVTGMTEVNGKSYTITVTGANTFTIGVDTTLFTAYAGAGNWETNNTTDETSKQIEPGTVVITMPVGIVFTDNGTGQFTSVTPGNSGFINYTTGNITLTTTAVAGDSKVTFNYFPCLPCMGIPQRELANINNEQTILFDQKYAYTYVSQNFQEVVPGITWAGNDSQFFWGTNYRGSDASNRLFFVTNFTLPTNNPVRYFDGANWTDFTPRLDSVNYLWQAQILVSYYGRLLAINTYEGTTAATANNYFNRCRFSQIGDPLQSDAWRSDQFGKGGFIDAPTNERAISAIFFKNTLIVFFERTTWQLRYVGDYGIPFIWERISSDFGCESPFSAILFDDGVLVVGNRAIIASSGVNVQRIDLDIPDLVFSFRNADNGTLRVHGIRDFQKELVYWCYPASQPDQKFPNYSLLFNYRNKTFAIFRNTVTAFGRLASPSGITWDSQDVTWDDDVLWDDFIQEEFQDTISGNHQGYIHFYGEPNSETIADSSINAFDQESMFIKDIDLTGTKLIVTSPNHNLQNDEIIYIVKMMFVDPVTFQPVTTDLNNKFYSVNVLDADTFEIYRWDFDEQEYIYDFSFTPATNSVYIGGGEMALFPVPEIITKDFAPFGKQGMQSKLAYVDFLTDATPNASISVQLYGNTSIFAQGNQIIGQQQSETSTTSFGYITAATQDNPCQITTFQPHGLANGSSILIDNVQGMTDLNGNIYTITYVDSNNFTLNGVDSSGFGVYTSGGTYIQRNYPFYVEGINYTWHRFYGGATGNFFTLKLFYDDNQMNVIQTHQQDFILNAIQLWVRPGGKGVF